MKTFVLTLKVRLSFKHKKAFMEWSSKKGKILSDIPDELYSSVFQLIEDCNCVLSVLSYFFKPFSKNKKQVVASASVKFFGENENWQLAFSIPSESEENKYIRTLLFRLLTDRKAFLKEVKAIEKMI
ncbi:hypothetical protein CEP49_06635 [Mergibacter septicus]|uniref:hypothetical protein n=1 Tax=Mergibacter septicus TaxID=221402 RepID=UPI0011798573|nr:hypothetical protein [Mergibacter septicus]AWX14247.1 hypothetical protein CEP49_06635 [Mergibacter septicus]